MPRPNPSGGQAPALHFPSHPLWIPAFAGMTNGTPVRRVGEPWNAGTLVAPQLHFRTNDEGISRAPDEMLFELSIFAPIGE